jgi:hypothetical protein
MQRKERPEGDEEDMILMLNKILKIVNGNSDINDLG